MKRGRDETGHKLQGTHARNAHRGLLQGKSCQLHHARNDALLVQIESGVHIWPGGGGFVTREGKRQEQQTHTQQTGTGGTRGRNHRKGACQTNPPQTEMHKRDNRKEKKGNTHQKQSWSGIPAPRWRRPAAPHCPSCPATGISTRAQALPTPPAWSGSQNSLHAQAPIASKKK